MTRPFKIGDRVRVVGNSSGHCFNIGDIGTLKQGPDRDGDFRRDSKIGGWLDPNDIELVTPAPEPWSPFNNCIAHGLLSDDQRAQIEAEGPWECYESRWFCDDVPDFAAGRVYRRAPKPALTQDVIPWAHIDPIIVRVRRNKHGIFYGAEANQPLGVAGWWQLTGIVAGLIPGTVAWQDSLQKRPTKGGV